MLVTSLLLLPGLLAGTTPPPPRVCTEGGVCYTGARDVIC